MSATLRAALLAGLVVAHAAAAHAGDDCEHRARSYFAIGQGHFNLGEYREAVEAFQAGYRCKALPLFLFNVAQAALHAGDLALAEDAYVKYLEREPSRSAPQRVVATQQLLKLRRQLRERPAAPEPPRAGEATAAAPSAQRAAPLPVAPASSTPAPASSMPAPATSSVAPASAMPVPAPAALPPSAPSSTAAAAPAASIDLSARAVQAPRPLWKRGWLWGTIAAALVGGAAIGVGAWLGAEAARPAPHRSLGSVEF